MGLSDFCWGFLTDFRLAFGGRAISTIGAEIEKVMMGDNDLMMGIV